MNYLAVVMMIFAADKSQPIDVGRFEDISQCVAAAPADVLALRKQGYDVVKVECWTDVPGEKP